MKTTIYLPDELGRKLAQEAEERGLSLSQLIREKIENSSTKERGEEIFSQEESLATLISLLHENGALLREINSRLQKQEKMLHLLTRNVVADLKFLIHSWIKKYQCAAMKEEEIREEIGRHREKILAALEKL
ncbi:ribbon-helix-helix domain-containing protein [Thermodesulfatator indicus]